MRFQFCGGCNPRFSRGDWVKQLRAYLAEKGAELPGDQVVVEVFGCKSCIATQEPSPYHIVVTDDSQIQDVARELLALGKTLGETENS